MRAEEHIARLEAENARLREQISQLLGYVAEIAALREQVSQLQEQLAELHGAYELLPQLSRGMLLMHDAHFFGGAYLEVLNAKGVLALFARPRTVGVQRRRNLPDGSYLARLMPNARAVYPMQKPVWVRVIEYQLTDERLGEPGQVYRLASTWLNPRTAPAKELIVLSHERLPDRDRGGRDQNAPARAAEGVAVSHAPGRATGDLRAVRGAFCHPHPDASLRARG